VLLLGYFALFSIGSWPFSPVEGDEVGVLTGVGEMGKRHPDQRWFYLFPLHAGSHHLIRLFLTLGAPTPELAFGLATAIGAILSFIFSTLVLKRLAGTGWVAAALWLAAIPETAATAFYLNTSAIGAAFVWPAVALATGPATIGRSLAAGVLMGIGGWMRIDGLGIGLAIPILWWRFDRPRAIRASALLAITTPATLFLLSFLSSISWADALSIWSARTAIIPAKTAIGNSLLAIGPIMALATLVGLLNITRLKDRLYWAILLLLSILPTAAAHSRHLTTPKYLYYALPFIALPGLLLITRTLEVAQRRGRFVMGFIVSLLILDWFSAFRFWQSQRRRWPLDAPAATLASVQLGSTKAEWVLGEGEMIPTDDGWRPKGGYGFAPIRWHKAKIAANDIIAQIAKQIQTQPETDITTCGWLSRQVIVAELLRQGFAATPARLHDVNEASTYTQEWQAADGRRCHMLALGVFHQSLVPSWLDSTRGRTRIFVTDLNSRPDIIGTWKPLGASTPKDITFFKAYYSTESE
jgi:hypothetical protein